jgi:hypothetical protein
MGAPLFLGSDWGAFCLPLGGTGAVGRGGTDRVSRPHTDSSLDKQAKVQLG